MEQRSFVWKKGSSQAGKGAWQEKVCLGIYGAIILVLIYVIVLVITTPFFIGKQLRVTPSRAAHSLQSLPPLSDIGHYKAIMAKNPLFGVKQKEIIVPVRSACAEFESKYVLTGIITGGQNEALFKTKVGNKTQFVTAGESFGGVTFESISAQSVMIKCAGKQVELMMEGA